MPCDHETFIWGTLYHHKTFCFVDFGSNDYFSYKVVWGRGGGGVRGKVQKLFRVIPTFLFSNAVLEIVREKKKRTLLYVPSSSLLRILESAPNSCRLELIVSKAKANCMELT